MIDGVLVNKRKHESVTPILGSLLNLPPEMRSKFSNMSIFGFFIGTSYPDMQQVLKPIIDEFVYSYEHGHALKLPNCSIPKVSRSVIIYFDMDMIMKMMVLYMCGPTCKEGCSKCNFKGKATPTIKGGNPVKWPCTNSKLLQPLRTKEQWIEHATTADENRAMKRLEMEQKNCTQSEIVFDKAYIKINSNGIKGQSELLRLHYLDITHSCLVQPMHCIIENVCKTLLKALFDPKYEQYAFNLAPVFNQLEERYNDFKLLSGKQCIPTLANWSSWKADQIRTFFLYLIVPLLWGWLPSKQAKVINTFHKCLFIMFKPVITENELAELDRKLKEVYFAISDPNDWLEEFVTLNMHDMIHLAQQIKLTGSLCYTSGFICETGVGAVKKCMLLKYYCFIVANSVCLVAIIASKAIHCLLSYVKLNRAVKFLSQYCTSSHQSSAKNEESDTIQQFVSMAANIDTEQSINCGSESIAEEFDENENMTDEIMQSQSNLTHSATIRNLRQHEHYTHDSKFTVVGTPKEFALENPGARNAFHSKFPNKSNTSVIHNTYARLCIESGHDIYSTSYKFKSQQSTRKDSSFFLYTRHKDVPATLATGFIGQAHCFFMEQNQYYCLVSKYSFIDSMHAKEHSSGMYMIKMVSTGFAVINVDLIVNRLMCIYSTKSPLEYSIIENVDIPVGLLALHVHRDV